MAGLPELSPGHFLRLTVKDTGHGMDRKTVERIFDPFFTTKERGEGTGLGLSIVHGIIRSYDGAIRVESRLGEGTRFEIYLPLEETVEEVNREKHQQIPRGGERVLLVDDEPMIVEIHSNMLRALGYRVTCETDPRVALQTFSTDPQGFDLVITDMTMPRLTGDKLASEIMQIRPGMPVILCTGFSERISQEMTTDLGIRAFVMKPIGLADIANKIREVLG